MLTKVQSSRGVKTTIRKILSPVSAPIQPSVARNRPADLARAYTVNLTELAALSTGCGLGLFSTDGSPEPDPSQCLMSAINGERRLDHHLTLSSELAMRLGVDALWYHARSEEHQPERIHLRPLHDLTELLDLLAPELEQFSIALCDPAGRVAAVNGTAERLLSHAANGAILGRPIEQILQLENLLQRSEVTTRDVELSLDSNSGIGLSVTSSPFRSGWLIRLQSRPFLSPAFTDWRALIDHYPGTVIRLDRYGRILFANRKIGSFKVEEVEGRNVFDFVRNDSRATVTHFREQLIHHKQSLSGEVPVLDPRTQKTLWFSFQAVPILLGTDVQVVVYSIDITKRVRTEERLAASQKRIRALSSRLDHAQEEERRRISRELHDELGGTLTALRLEIGALEKIDNLPTLAKEKLEAVEGTLSITLSTVRRLASQLRPQILDDLGLSAALESMLKEASRRMGFEYDFQAPREIPGDNDLHLHLYRISQEALTNICRHSQATRVRLRLTRPLHDRLELHIEDNGEGYRLDCVGEKASLGLSGMTERVDLINGQLEIITSPGKGCRLRAQVPLNSDSTATPP